jgi:hypothetical protein
MSLPPDEPSVSPTRRVQRIELTCLLCGEIAGVLEDRRVVRPRAPGSVRFQGRLLRCGRCGSPLLPGEEDHSPIPAPDMPELA